MGERLAFGRCNAIFSGANARHSPQFDHSSTAHPPRRRPHIAPMKFHADKPDSLSITAIGEGWVAVNGERHHSSRVLTSAGQIQAWACERFEHLTAAHFETLLNVMPEPPELVIFGSGQRLRFAPPVLMRTLIERRIGVETMDTAAACRTFNILATEGRRVVAALIIGD